MYITEKSPKCLVHKKFLFLFDFKANFELFGMNIQYILPLEGRKMPKIPSYIFPLI